MSEGPRLALPYHSGAGHTRLLARAAAEGAAAAGARAQALEVEALFDDAAAGWAALDAADAILLAAPTWMGAASGPFKTFMDASSDRWAAQAWTDKLAAGLTVATFPSGDKLATLTQFAIFAAQHGMIWVGQAEIGAPAAARDDGVNAAGAWLGVAATIANCVRVASLSPD
ncbi:MAG: NAD(P)H-dependent oxidoreductase, partial [Pseudomonadota bacterium]